MAPNCTPCCMADETFSMPDSCKPLFMPAVMLLILLSCHPVNFCADVLERPDNCTPWPPSAATDEMTPNCTLFTESCTLTMPTGERWAMRAELTTNNSNNKLLFFNHCNFFTAKI